MFMLRFSRCCIYILGSLAFLCGHLLELPNLPTPQKPHGYSRCYVHEAREDLGVEIDVPLLLP